MAFVTVDNPGGVLHHGGQMAWTTISDTRIAMVTITADFKALIQEINQVNGAPVVGAPSYITTLPTAQTPNAGWHMRPKIKYMGNDRVFVMVPTTWAAPSTAFRTFNWGNNTGVSEQTGTRFPTVYTGYVMERNSSGQYTVKSSAQIDTLYNVSVYNSSPHFALTITSASSTEIVINRAIRITNQNNAGINNYKITIPVTNGVLGVPAGAMDSVQVYSGFQQNLMVAEFKTCKDMQGRSVEMYAIDYSAIGSYDNSVYRAIWQPPLRNGQRDSCYLLSGHSNYATLPYRSAPILPNLSLGGIVPISADVQGDFYATGGNNPQTAAMFMANSAAMPDILTNPLDTAYVTSTGIVCVVGGKNVTTVPTVVFDCDLGASLYQLFAGTNADIVLPLKLSFRLPSGIGHFFAPNDPITIPYFYKERMNNNRVIHRVDDKHFWLVGCFMDSEVATPKLGVISVSIP